MLSIGSTSTSIVEMSKETFWCLSSLSRIDLEKLSSEAKGLFSRRSGSETSTKALKAIVACYRVVELAEPAVFLGGAVMAIEDFPSAVVERLGSFKHGIVRQAKFLPTIAELVAWCEAEEARLRSNANAVNSQIATLDHAANRAIEEAERRERREKERLEWEAGEPERKRRAEAAEKLAREAAEKHSREEAIRVKRNQVRAAWMAQVCKAVSHDAILTERMYSLLADDDVSDQATDFEASMPGSGSRFVLAKMGAAE